MKKQTKREINPVIQDDILRYKKNKFAANFALLALVFNCLYFMLFYSINITGLYTILLGLSVIVNLFILLLGFFSSEGIKGYNGKFAYVLFGLAAAQIVRIFIFPLMGMQKDWLRGNYYFGIKMTSALQGIILIVFLVLSAACFIFAGVQGLITAKKLQSFQKKLDNGEVSVEETLAELDREDEKKEQNAIVAEVAQAQPAEAVEVAEKPVEAEDKTLSSKEEDNG